MISRDTIWQGMRFGFVGALAVGAHYGIAVATSEWLQLNIQIANLIGFWSGFLLSYFGQTVFTFLVQPSIKTFLSYLALGGGNYVASAVIVYVASIWLPIYLVFAITVVLIPLISFFVSKFIIFRA